MLLKLSNNRCIDTETGRIDELKGRKTVINEDGELIGSFIEFLKMSVVFDCYQSSGFQHRLYSYINQLSGVLKDFGNDVEFNKSVIKVDVCGTVFAVNIETDSGGYFHEFLYIFSEKGLIRHNVKSLKSEGKAMFYNNIKVTDNVVCFCAIAYDCSEAWEYVVDLYGETVLMREKASNAVQDS